MKLFQRISGLKRWLWDCDTDLFHPLLAWLIVFFRIIHATIRDLSRGTLSLQAMGLVYTTLLALVPLLAVSFSVLKAFGVHNQIEPMLLAFLTPLGPKGGEITTYIITFVENVKVGILGTVGLGLFIVTVVSLIKKVELAFNSIWHVKNTRPMLQRFSKYLSVITIGPTFVFIALGITATLTSAAFIQDLVSTLGLTRFIAVAAQLVPYAFVILAFFCVYMLIPNTKVRISSAIIGAIVAGVLWQTTGWAFASFVAGSTRYTAIYSGLAILILFMFWIYISWLILLTGSSIAFYHQHPVYLRFDEHHDFKLSSRLKDKLALLIMFHIGENYYQNKAPYNQESLAALLGVPVDIVAYMTDALIAEGIITWCGDQPTCFLPARDLESVTVASLINSIRNHDETPQFNADAIGRGHSIETIINRIDEGLGHSLTGLTLKDIATTDQTLSG